MKSERVGLSLRYKLLALLTLLPLVSLALYLLMATRLFEADKIAYVFDASASVSRFLGITTKMELDSFQTTVRPILETLDFSIGEFTATAQELFAAQERVELLIIDFTDRASAKPKTISLNKKSENALEFVKNSDLIQSLRIRLGRQNPVLSAVPSGSPHVIIGQRIKVGTQDLQVLALFRSESLVRSFSKGSLYKSFLANGDGQPQLGEIAKELASGEWDTVGELKKILNGRAPEGTAEIKGKNGGVLLASYSMVGQGDLSVISLVDKTKALSAVKMMISKSILFFLALLAGTMTISVFASAQLTSTLRELFEATQQMARGDFGIKIQIRSSDEVGGLAKSFNWMAGEVSRLLLDSVEKARMESELNTVKTVQETLFPASEAKFGSVTVVGHFEPASECGGDWWNYSKVDERLFLWIGDATGHGASTALITSAAKSAAAVIEELPDMTCAKALRIMNRAIHETSKGQIMMTFFLGCLDLKTLTLSYANASHDPPYLLRSKKGRKPTRNDLIPLMDKNGPRLGENPRSDYSQAEIHLQPGDTLFFYTDGILDIESPTGVVWGEREFLKNVIKAAAEGSGSPAKLKIIVDNLISHRKNIPLKDDVTLFLCDIQKEVA